MSRILTFCAAILMLALVATVPVLAEAPEAPAQIEQAQAEPVMLDLDQTEKPLMTPAEQPTESDLLGLNGIGRVDEIGECTSAQAASVGCEDTYCCSARGSQVWCYC